MKKMRKLIPALSMLMVAAIMLTTASFAWFTMNETVTATGVQIQAKSDGSLIIGTSPLTWQSNGTSVDVSEANEAFKAVRKLTPVNFLKDTGVWQKPDMGTNGATIDPATGLFVGDEKWVAVDTGTGYYAETAFYIASAGDKLEKQSLTLSLAALSAPITEAVEAYAMAIYVVPQGNNGEWAPVTHTQKADAIIYVDEMDGRNTVTLTNGNAGYTIPSIVGVGAQDTKTTGLQIVVRFYVDGDLQALTTGESGTFVPAEKDVVTGITYEEANSFVAGNAYFIKEGTGENEKYVPAVTEGWTTKPDGVTLYTQVLEYGKSQYNYVNNDEVPTSGTSLEISIKSQEIVTQGN